MIGTVIAGSYRVIGVLGAGAMGIVYRAEDIARGTPVAIKVLHKTLSASKEAAARFRREAFVGVRMIHPNCVPVSDFGTAEDGSVYMAMDLLDGEPLGALIDRHGRLPWRRALHIARHVLRGLDYAHCESVVHRDIKPDNIFVTDRDGDPYFATLLDFGIAKLVGDAAGHAITQAGIAVGTPRYLSPEQATGSPLDARSDLYSLSVVLYELLTGRTPFGDRETLNIVLAHISEPVPTFADVAPLLDVPAEVEELVRDGLAKRPDDRISSANEYIVRIEALLGPERPAATNDVRPAAAKPPKTPPPIAPARTDAPPAAVTNPSPVAPAAQRAAQPRPHQRRRLFVALGILAVLAVAGVVIVVSGGQGAANEPPASRPAPAAPEPPTLPPEVASAISALEGGKNCTARRKAVSRLRTLGHPAAIPVLEKARSRMWRGKNTNACLRSAADAAIKHLRAAADRDSTPAPDPTGG